MKNSSNTHCHTIAKNGDFLELPRVIISGKTNRSSSFFIFNNVETTFSVVWKIYHNMGHHCSAQNKLIFYHRFIFCKCVVESPEFRDKDSKFGKFVPDRCLHLRYKFLSNFIYKHGKNERSSYEKSISGQP